MSAFSDFIRNASVEEKTKVYSEVMDAVYDSQLETVREALMEQMLALPRPGTPAADLTDQEKFALAVRAGAPYRSEMVGYKLTLTTAVPVGIADRGDGTYIVAIGAKHD